MDECHSDSIFNSIQKYFTPAAWNQMGSYEKKSYLNIVQNYNVMCSLGLNPTKPHFMEHKPQLSTKRKSSSRETGLSRPKHRRLQSEDESPLAISSFICEEEEPFQNLNIDLFSPEEKQRGIRLHNIFTAALSVYKRYRRRGRVVWVSKMYQLPCGHKQVVRRIVPVGLNPSDVELWDKQTDEELTVKQPDQEVKGKEPTVKQPDQEVKGKEPTVKQPDQEVKGKEPTVKQPDQEVKGKEPTVKQPDQEVKGKEPTVKQPDQEVKGKEPVVEEGNPLPEAESDAEKQREFEKLKKVFVKLRNKKQYRTVQTQTVVSAESSEEIDIWTSLVFRHRDDEDPAPAEAWAPPPAANVDPEIKRKQLAVIAEFKRANWKTVETQTEKIGEVDLSADYGFFAWLFENEGDEFGFLSQSEADQTVPEVPDINKTGSVEFNEEFGTKIYDNEGDEFEFASVPETDPPEEAKEISTVNSKEQNLVKTYENEGDEFEFSPWGALDCVDDVKDTTKANSKLEGCEILASRESQGIKNVESLDQIPDEEMHTFGFTQEEQEEESKNTKPETQDEFDFSDFDFEDSPQETKKSNGKENDNSELSQKLTKVKSKHAAKSKPTKKREEAKAFTTVNSKEQNLVKTYENEGDEFEFSPWGALDCVDDESKNTKQETQDEFDFSDFDFEDSPQETKKSSGKGKDKSKPSRKLTKAKSKHRAEPKPTKKRENKNASKQVSQSELDFSDLDFGYSQQAEEETKEENKREAKPSQQKEEIEPQDASSSKQERVSRYPKRNTTKVNYRDEEDLQDDDFIFCDLCDHEHLGDCPEHGPHKHFVDSYAPVDGTEDRDLRTTPAMLRVATSQIPMGGSGVWADYGLPGYLRLGPYQGKKAKNPDNLGYSWAIKKNKKIDHYVAAGTSVNSNWMRFVNCARHESEQNVMAFQYKGELYYRTVKPVPPKVELMVWYGKEYAAQLGIDLEKFRSKDTSHIVSLVFSCKECDRTYTSPLYLENHHKFCRGQRKTVGKVKPDAVTTDVQTLAKVVDEKKMFCCDLCSYQTNNSGSMKCHIAAHTGAKPFQCDVCDKAFTEAANLTKHKLIHSGEKPYKCTECSYAANQASHLRRHMTQHTGEKVFACKLCKYKTVDSGHLTDHVRKHTGDKPYTCTQCDYKSAQSSNLKSHILRKHSSDKPFSCLHCEYKSAVKCNLTQHMKRKHSDKPT